MNIKRKITLTIFKYKCPNIYIQFFLEYKYLDFILRQNKIFSVWEISSSI